MLRLFTIGAAAGAMFPVAAAYAEPPCKPSPRQLCFDVPVGSADNKPTPQQRSQQSQKSSAPLPNSTHDRRLKIDDDTSFGLGGRGLGIKRSF